MTLAKSDRNWISGTAEDGVVTIGDPRLKRATSTVHDVREVRGLIDDMVARLRKLNGAGLAAPQIGASEKIVVIEVRKTDVFPDRPTSPLLRMINPVITERSDATEPGWEGCFSVPGMMGIVPRHESVTVEYTTADGAHESEQFVGYVARVIQHEIDHLDGIEFVDRMPSMASLTTVQNYIDHHSSGTR
jgi:peptide deformylase